MTTYWGDSIGTFCGIKGTSAAGFNFPPIQGWAYGSSNAVYGNSAVSYYGAIAGVNTALSGYGVYGQANGGYGIAIYGSTTGAAATAVAAVVSSGSGIALEARNYGTGRAIVASCTNSSLVGLDLYGSILTTGTTSLGGSTQVFGILTKGGGSFLIDHPLDPANKYLEHSFVESPERKNVYDGIGTADKSGEFTVSLPTYFEILNVDFRYQLTPLGGAAPGLHIKEEIKGGRFVVGGAAPDQRVCWQVTGNRQDAFAKAHPMKDEYDKSDEDKGLYLYPELVNEPAEKRIGPRHAPRRPEPPEGTGASKVEEK